jgi:cysteine-rich repeat protein
MTAANDNTHISGNTSANMWIGVNDVSVNLTYVWASGSAYGAYTNWAGGEPSDVSGTDDCGVMLDPAGTWDIQDCTTSKAYVCEGPGLCGNGVSASTQQCDDGGLVNGDGCSSTCTIESGYGCTPTNPSVCSVISQVVLDSIIAYKNPSGGGIIIEWLGIYDPTSVSFEVVRRGPRDKADVKVNASFLQGTSFGHENQPYRVFDPEGTLDDTYWVLEKKFDGTTSRYGGIKPSAEKPTAHPALASGGDFVTPEHSGQNAAPSEKPVDRGCQLSGRANNLTILFIALCYFGVVAYRRRRRRL